MFPLGVVTLLGVIVLFLDLWVKGARREWIPAIAANGLAAAGLACVWSRFNHGFARDAMNHSIDMDRSVLAFTLIFIACAVFSLWLVPSFVRRYGIAAGPYSTLVVFSIVGMIMMAQASDLLTMFLGPEIMSVA